MWRDFMFFLNVANNNTYFRGIGSDIKQGYILMNINPIPFREI